MRQKFRLYATLKDGSPNRRFYKYRYTAALRLGLVPSDAHGATEFCFQGQPTHQVKGHDGNEAFIGELSADGQTFRDIVFLARPRADGQYHFITFWPSSQHPDAHKSYTDPLVDTAMDGTPFDIEVVATSMHERFQDNAGVSPATLMKIIYEHEAQDLRLAAEKLGDLVDELNHVARLEGERADREQQRADQAEGYLRMKEAEFAEERARYQAELKAAKRDNSHATLSEPDVLVRVKENVMHRGSICTILEFADGSTKHMKVSQFDPLGIVTKKAKTLEGQRVRTTCWDPINSPGKWSSQGYFRNVYAVE
jgi:hypothetical protein